MRPIARLVVTLTLAALLPLSQAFALTGLPWSLQFGAATSDVVTVPAAAGINHTFSSQFTWVIAFRLTTITDLRILVGKGHPGVAQGPRLRIVSASNNLQWTHTRNTTNSTTTSNDAALAVGVTYCWGGWHDGSAQTPKQYLGIYTGSAPPFLRQLTDSGSGTAGSADGGDDSGQDLHIGNQAGGSQILATQGQEFFFQEYTRLLTQNEIALACAGRQVAGLEAYLILGQNATGLVYDWSGHNHYGTVSGAIPTSIGIPSLTLWPLRSRAR